MTYQGPMTLSTGTHPGSRQLFFVYSRRRMRHDESVSKDSMSPTARFDFAGLSDAERILLAGELLDMAYSSMTPLTPEQIADLERYDADADAGRVTGEPWEAVRARLKPRG
jgi:putative addiction module component (TIGR02574 family)